MAKKGRPKKELEMKKAEDLGSDITTKKLSECRRNPESCAVQSVKDYCGKTFHKPSEIEQRNNCECGIYKTTDPYIADRQTPCMEAKLNQLSRTKRRVGKNPKNVDELLLKYNIENLKEKIKESK